MSSYRVCATAQEYYRAQVQYDNTYKQRSHYHILYIIVGTELHQVYKENFALICYYAELLFEFIGLHNFPEMLLELPARHARIFVINSL